MGEKEKELAGRPGRRVSEAEPRGKFRAVRQFSKRPTATVFKQGKGTRPTRAGGVESPARPALFGVVAEIIDRTYRANPEGVSSPSPGLAKPTLGRTQPLGPKPQRGFVAGREVGVGGTPLGF